MTYRRKPSQAHEGVRSELVPVISRDPWSDITEKDMAKLGMLQLSLNEVSDYYGIDKDVLFQLLKLRPELRIAYCKGKARGIVTAASHLLRKVADGDLFAQKYYLDAAGWRRGLRETPAYGGDDDASNEIGDAGSQNHGVLIVPMDAVSIEDWEQRQRDRAAAGNSVGPPTTT